MPLVESSCQLVLKRRAGKASAIFCSIVSPVSLTKTAEPTPVPVGALKIEIDRAPSAYTSLNSAPLPLPLSVPANEEPPYVAMVVAVVGKKRVIASRAPRFESNSSRVFVHGALEKTLAETVRSFTFLPSSA